MKRILVTGGAGFIGSFLVDELINRKYDVTIFDNLEPQVHPGGGEPNYVNKKAKFIKGNVLDYNKFKSVVKKADAIFHFAAMVGVGQSQYQIKRYVDVNISGTATLLDILVNEKNNVKKLVIAASMSSYGEGEYNCSKCGPVKGILRTEQQIQKDEWELRCDKCKDVLTPVPTDEESSLNCSSIYSLSKRVQEEMCLTIGKVYKLPVASLRFFNVFGPRQSLSNPYTGVAAIFMSRIKSNNQPVVFEDGLQTRDFIYVTDLVNACVLALEKDEANYKIFNVGTGNPVTIKQFAIDIARAYNKDIKPEINNKFRKGDIRHCYADITKIKIKLGFSPKISFQEGIKKLIEWADTVKSVDKYEQAYRILKQKKLV